jgi:hypothetical protein
MVCIFSNLMGQFRELQVAKEQATRFASEQIKLTTSQILNPIIFKHLLSKLSLCDIINGK